ncbi:hypothetical protein ACFT5B_14930 [Luteimicrobium sp. NPDC057192]|uniref:hypothetical protein n=1 Tax=Luteimicrobium sp. NPDC057192 TaxID=3346042 RepID=UPI003626C21C
MNLVVRAAFVGAAAGSRSSLGLAQPFLTSGHRALRIVGLLGVGAELVGDKLPATPSRLDPPGPVVRAIAGAVGAATLTRRAGSRPGTLVAAALLGAAASAVGTFGGAAWRRAVAERGGPDLPAALAEDAAAVTLAALAR